MTDMPRKPQTLIAVVTHQRSGTKWFGSMIRHRYGAMSLGEIFHPEDTSILSFKAYLSRYSVEDLVGSDADVRFKDYFNELRTYCGLFYTFDVMFNQMDWLNFGWRRPTNVIYNHLKSHDDIVISLLRDPKNIFISMKLLEHLGKSHYTEMDCAAERVEEDIEATINLSYDDFEKFVNELQMDRQKLRECFNGYENYIEINYEDLLRDPSSAFETLDLTLRKFGEQIGHTFSTGIHPFPSLVKTPIDYSSLIQNIDEVLSWPI